MHRDLDLSRARTAIGAAAVVGLLAGLVVAVFFSFAGEPRIEDAITIEEARAAQHTDVDAHDHATDDDGVEVSREAQRGVGLFAAMALAGGMFGALLGIAFVALRSIVDPARRALVAGALLGGSITLAPWFKYPPNPPAVGDPDTVDRRQFLYVTLICIAIAVGVTAIRVGRRLATRQLAPVPRLAAVAATVVVPMTAALALLPPNDDPVAVPAKLIWQFRIVSLAGNALLWTLLTLGVAWLAARPDPGSRDEDHLHLAGLHGGRHA